MALIDSRLAEALRHAGKLERRAETAINDGKDEKACVVLAQLRGHANSNLVRVRGLVESLTTGGYSPAGYDEYVKDFEAFRTYAIDRLAQLKGTTPK